MTTIAPTANASFRPTQVKLGVLFWACGAVLNLVTWGEQIDWSNGVMYPIFGVTLVFSLLLLWLVYQGKNWARWILVPLVSFRALGLLHAFRDDSMSGLQLVWACTCMACQVTAVLLLFSRGSAGWYHRGKTSG